MLVKCFAQFLAYAHANNDNEYNMGTRSSGKQQQQQEKKKCRQTPHGVYVSIIKSLSMTMTWKLLSIFNIEYTLTRRRSPNTSAHRANERGNPKTTTKVEKRKEK